MVFEARYLLCQYQFKNSSRRDILIVTLSREGAEIANVMIYLLFLMNFFFFWKPAKIFHKTRKDYDNPHQASFALANIFPSSDAANSN